MSTGKIIDITSDSIDWSAMGDVTLQGLPQHVNSDLNLSFNKLPNLEGISTYVGRHVDIRNNPLTTLQGWTQSEVYGNFIVNSSKLTNLEFAPVYVKDSFHVSDSELTSLEGGPKVVNLTYNCSRNKLTNFKGAPRTCAVIEATENLITSLVGLPSTLGTMKRTGYLDVSNNSLTDLNHCPLMYNGKFKCKLNQLTSLDGCPNHLNQLDVSNNRLTSLKGIHKYFKNGNLTDLNISGNLITSHLLGLLLIPGLQKITCDNAIAINTLTTRAMQQNGVSNKTIKIFEDLDAAMCIIIKHRAVDADIIDCQQELIEAGLKKFAQL